MELIAKELHFEAISHLEVWVPETVAAAVTPAVSFGYEVGYRF